MQVGVFDSGLGGISVLKEIHQRVPTASLAYVADSAWVPYGARSDDFIQQRAQSLTHFLIEHGADIVVVACNTATAAAVPLLRESVKVPIVGMEPAVKPATAATRSGTVGVLATAGTLKSVRFAALLDQFGGDIEVLTRICPGLVEQVEAGDLDGPQTRTLVNQFVTPLIQAGADTLVLGCTHFAFLRPLIEQVAGPDVKVIDTGEAVARRVEQVAKAIGEGFHRSSGVAFWTSGDTSEVTGPLRKLWGAQVTLVDLPGEYSGRGF